MAPTEAGQRTIQHVLVSCKEEKHKEKQTWGSGVSWSVPGLQTV